MNPDFITPFLLSCSTRNAKFSTIAIQCLNKLILSRAIPISKLDLLLDAFIEATHLAVDIQLKVLQTLPTLFQIYGEFINNGLVAKLLLICSMLQAPSKIPMVINTSAATQQQIVLSLFDKILEDDKTDVEKEFTVKIDEDEDLKISSSAFDAYNVLNDLCSLVEHQKPTFLTFKTMSESFGFELLENVLTNYQDVFLSHTELGFLVRTRITPLLLRSFSNHRDFLIIVRVSRIILLLIRTQISILEIEAEVMLSLLTHVISKESNVPYWKKVLSLEIFNAVLSDFDLVKYIFSSYDYHEDKKKIIDGFLSVCSEIVKEPWATRVLQINDIVLVPAQEHSITMANSALKIPYIDLLDKNEAPPAPKAYTLYLILSCTNSISEGIGNFIRKISTNDSNTFTFLNVLSSENHEQSEALQMKTLVTSNAKSIVSIGAEFLYASLGNELFHALIRALQKLCHAAGVLGLNAERDSLLMLFSIATISNNLRRNSKSLSISETIVETISHSIAPSPASTPNIQRFHQRYLNSRHIICFRALVSLVISLGPTLKKSWKFILSTFQWFDYYLNGPSEYLSFKETPPKPELANTDLKSAESSFSKLFESTADYDDEAFRDGLNELISISRTSVFDKIDNSEPIIEDDILLCPYNRDFFIKKLVIVSKFNAKRYLEKGNKYWIDVVKFLSDVCTSPQVASDLRVTACATFNLSTKELAAVAFSPDSSFDKIYIESELLNSLARMVDRMLSSLGETQLSTSESEMIHDTLKTLYELLDRFGTHLSHSWEAVIHIVDCPFKFFEVSKNVSSQKQLLKSAFEILQLVLNDFLQTIPLKIMIKIIDVLQKFCTQEYELNISFSAISYYWLISDYFRHLVPNEGGSELSFNNKEELLQALNNTDKYTEVHSLWLYLLSSIVNISNDPRPEVRNGTMQTFFRIIDSHGSYLNWNKTYSIVVKELLNIEFGNKLIEDPEIIASYKDSVSIILKGLTDLYCRFFIGSDDIIYWEGLLEFFQKLVKWNATEITFFVYKSFNEVTGSFKTIDVKIFDLLFEFWSSQNITYVVSDTDNYQNCIVELIGSFKSLYKLSDVSVTQLEKALSIFNNAIRFPFLPRFTRDIQKSTKVQAVVLECLEVVDISTDSEVLSLMLSHMASIILLPFQTRARIVKKLQGKGKIEVPSFIAVSNEALGWLKSTLGQIKDYSPLVPNKSFLKVFKNLLDAVQSKVDDQVHQENILEYGLWKNALSILLLLGSEVSPLLGQEEMDESKTDIFSEVWDHIIDSIVVSLPVANDSRDESFNEDIYQKFKESILPNIGQEVVPDVALEKLVSSVWKSSFLYENDEIEEYLLKKLDSPAEVTHSLLSTQLNDYTTEPLKILPQQHFRTICLQDLFMFSDLHSAKRLATKTLPFLICRLVLSFKKFAGSQKLLYYAPASSVQQKELDLSLIELESLISKVTADNIEGFKGLLELYPYILQNISSLLKEKESEKVLRCITSEFYRISSINK